MDIFITSLKIAENVLYGKKNKDCWERIYPKQIKNVKEYGFSNPFLQIITDNKKYNIGIFCKDFDKIIDFIENNTNFRIKQSFTHKFNQIFFKKKLF